MKLAMFFVFEIFEDVFSTFYFFLQKKNKFWTFWELLRKNTIGDAICKRFAKVSDFWKIKFFLHRKTLFFQKIQILNVLRLHQQKKTFEKHSKRKYPCLVFLKTFKCFSRKTSLFPKNPELKRLENSSAIVKIETQFRKTCKSRRFQKLSNFSLKSSIYLSKKTHFRRLRLFLGCKNFWYIF